MAKITVQKTSQTKLKNQQKKTGIKRKNEKLAKNYKNTISVVWERVREKEKRSKQSHAMHCPTLRMRDF